LRYPGRSLYVNMCECEACDECDDVVTRDDTVMHDDAVMRDDVTMHERIGSKDIIYLHIDMG